MVEEYGFKVEDIQPSNLAMSHRSSLVFQCTKLVGGRHSQPPRQSIHWTWRHVPMKVLSLTFACEVINML